MTEERRDVAGHHDAGGRRQYAVTIAMLLMSRRTRRERLLRVALMH